MTSYSISGVNYEISDDYNFTRSAWVNSLNNTTKELVLDFTIMWNMFEHQVFNDNFKSNYNANENCDICCEKVLSNKDNVSKINKVKAMFEKNNEKHNDLGQQYDSYGYKKCKISYDDFLEMNKSKDIKVVLKYLIYSCYRVRCNLFHGPKCVAYLDEQNLLFLSMNELLAIIARRYGY